VAWHLDRMLRVEAERLPALYPLLQGLAATPESRPALVARLRASPPWRPAFLARLAREVPAVGPVAPLYAALRARPPGLRPAEASAWLDRLMRDGWWTSAYVAWAGSLPADRRTSLGNVYNGDFELPLSDQGFDWRRRRIAGARVERGQTNGMGGGHALEVGFSHRRVPFRHLQQALALPPGDYRLEGRVKTEALATERGLAWFIACADPGVVLAQSDPVSGTAKWHEFTVDFTVPARDCGGQWLSLRLPSRIAAEERIGGTAWFDDITIKRQQKKTGNFAPP
jgi:hypothetical protein